MQLSVKVVGLDMARARLAEQGRKVDPVLRGALNTTATKGRTERYVKPLSGSLKGANVRRALKVKRANSRRMNARIIPSSSGVDVIDYRSWGFDSINATRARIWVRGPDGRKVAAGFVNPSSSGKRPLATRSDKARNFKQPERNKTPGITRYRYELGLTNAMGPSVAYWFKQLSSSATVRWINIFLQQEFERRIKRELAKASR